MEIKDFEKRIQDLNKLKEKIISIDIPEFNKKVISISTIVKNKYPKIYFVVEKAIVEDTPVNVKTSKITPLKEIAPIHNQRPEPIKRQVPVKSVDFSISPKPKKEIIKPKMAGFVPENIKKIIPVASSLLFMGIIFSNIKGVKQNER